MPRERLQEFQASIEPLLGALYRAAYRLTANRADAQDLVQETCVLAWERLPGLEDASHIEHWLLRALYHRFIDGTRRSKRAPVRLSNADDDPANDASSPAPGPDALAEHAELERRLDAAWLKLEPDHRVVIALRAEGYGLAEIEAITGVERAALRARLHRARRSLARHLENHSVAVRVSGRLSRTLGPPSFPRRLRAGGCRCRSDTWYAVLAGDRNHLGQRLGGRCISRGRRP